MRENMEDHTWSEEPCSSFREEIEKKMDCLEWKEIPGITEKFHKIHIFDNS